MTLQQLEYIVAVYDTGSFKRAAELCKITQPTLSQMIKKLEEELDLVLFDRSKKELKTTAVGLEIIKQSKKIISEAGKIKEIVFSEVSSLERPLRIGIIPTISVYLVPNFIEIFKKNYPQVSLSILEMPTQSLVEALEMGKIDFFIAATPLDLKNYFEIPLYYEKFVAYASSDLHLEQMQLSADTMPEENIWMLKEEHCLRGQVFNFCKQSLNYNQVFEAGNLETLVSIIEKNGGYSVIPELYVDVLSEQQKSNVYEIDNPPAVREVSIVIKDTFIKERLINAVADTIKEIVPKSMIDERLKQFAIRL